MNDPIADILRMANGTALSGRGKMLIPDEVMNILAGDEAQEALAKEKLLTEMRARQDNSRPSTQVDVSILEMEKDHVNEFLSKARQRIIKRSKPERIACCARIGGVLDQILGPEGGEYATPIKPEDPGQDDPAGGAPGDASPVATGTAAEDLAIFIHDEFLPEEHEKNCRNYQKPLLAEQKKFIQKAIKKPGALRAYYGVKEGEPIPLKKARADYARLKKAAEGE